MNNPKDTKATVTVWFSLILLILLSALLVAGTVLLPSVYDFNSRAEYPEYELNRTPVLILLYIALVPAYAAVICLFVLLVNIKNNRIFTGLNVKMIFATALCCFAECVVFGLIGKYFAVGYAVAVPALFIGAMLCVLCSVFGAAVRIKAENDYTI